MTTQYPVDNAASPINSGNAETLVWHDHEHVADSAKAQALSLVEQVGSVALAKQAVEAVVDLAGNTTPRTSLDDSLGFPTREELKTASLPIESTDGKSWFLTELPHGAWVVWNTQQHRTERQFSSRDEAISSIPREDPLTGSSMLS